jgi:hypothetical protein
VAFNLGRLVIPDSPALEKSLNFHADISQLCPQKCPQTIPKHLHNAL